MLTALPTVHVLVIEDNPDDVEYLKAILCEDSFYSVTVQWAQTLREAEEAVQTTQFQALLLDLSLPDSEGLETIEQVKKFAQDLPIVVLTGREDRELALQAVESGVQDYLVKGDGSFRSIKRILRYAIARHRAEQIETKLRLIEQREYFTAALAHDLKTPLVATQRIVSAFIDGLLGPLAEHQTDVMQHLYASNESMLMMLNNLLELYRLDAGGQKLVQKQLNLSVLVERCVLEFQELFRSKNLLVTTNWHGELTATVDELAMRRVFQNLLSNAIKFTDEDGQIAISSEDLGDEIVIRVSDNGCGMPKHQLDAVFARFYQTKKEYRGIGLGIGLHLCKKLVDAHFGTITCTSEPGVGTTFAIVLKKNLNSKRNSKVLIVEDNRTNQKILSSFLKNLSVDSDVVENGFDAVSAIHACNYDAVFLDLRMPELDGFATAKLLRSSGLKVPIIACTAYAACEDRVRFVDVGIDHILEKPIDTSRLESLVNRFSRNPSALRVS